MTDEQQSESGWEESEQLGPYQLHEQVPQSAHRQGELYRATHATSGAAALVLKPTAQDEADSPPPTDWQVRCTSSAAPRYLALEVERSRWTFAPDKHSVEELVFVFEDLRDSVRRMARFVPTDFVPTGNEPRPRRRWRLGLVLAGAAALLALALLPTTQAPAAEVQVQVQESTMEAWATDLDVDSVPVRPGETPRPVRNQKRAPCTAGLEVEVSGVCWLSVTQRPCPPQTVAWQGQCLLPVAVPRPPGTSLDGGDGSEPR
jgi:hypothetical protein